jgi:hypothetical protein
VAFFVRAHGGTTGAGSGKTPSAAGRGPLAGRPAGFGFGISHASFSSFSSHGACGRPSAIARTAARLPSDDAWLRSLLVMRACLDVTYSSTFLCSSACEPVCVRSSALLFSSGALFRSRRIFFNPPNAPLPTPMCLPFVDSFATPRSQMWRCCAPMPTAKAG